MVILNSDMFFNSGNVYIGLKGSLYWKELQYSEELAHLKGVPHLKGLPY